MLLSLFSLYRIMMANSVQHKCTWWQRVQAIVWISGHLLYIVDTIDRVFNLFPTGRQFWKIKEHLEREEHILKEPRDFQQVRQKEVHKSTLRPIKTVYPKRKASIIFILSVHFFYTKNNYLLVFCTSKWNVIKCSPRCLHSKPTIKLDFNKNVVKICPVPILNIYSFLILFLDDLTRKQN